MKAQFGWTDSTVGILALYLSLLFIPGALIFPSVMAISNMRFVTLGNAFLMALVGVLKVGSDLLENVCVTHTLCDPHLVTFVTVLLS